MEQRAREPSALQPRSRAQRREGEGPEGARQHQRRRAGLAAAQSAPEPSPGRRERRRVRAAARASGEAEGRRRRRTGAAGRARAHRLRVFLADPGKCGRPNPDQPPGSGAAEVRVPGSGWRASGGRLAGGFAVDMGAPGPEEELANSPLPGAASEPLLLLPPKPPCFRLRGSWGLLSGRALRGVLLSRKATHQRFWEMPARSPSQAASRLPALW